MTFRQRIMLDRLLAAPVAVFFNALARLLGQLLRRDHSMDPASTRQIVVSKLVGMGSILQATPLLRSLKQRFPAARLTFVTLEANRRLVERLQAVDEVLCLDDRGIWPMARTTLLTIVRLMRRRVDHYFDLEVYSAFSCLLTLFSLTRNRLGLYRHSNRFKKGIYTHLIYFNTRLPVRHSYLHLGRLTGVPAGADDKLGPIRIEAADREAMQKKLAAIGLPPATPYILVNPNASDLLIGRRWPASHMVEAITQLSELGHTLVLMGSPAEAEFVQSLCESVPAAARQRVFNSAGKLSLTEAFALIEGAACVLTNDTGPMHMAFALGKPTVCLFGPVDPTHYVVESPNIVSFYAPVPCSPCVHEVDEPPCLGNNICMQRLLPEPVIQSVLALMNQSTATEVPDKTVRLPLIWESSGGAPLGMVIRGSIGWKSQ